MLLLPGVLLGIAAAELLRARRLRFTWSIAPALAGASGVIFALPDSEALGSAIGDARWGTSALALAPLWCCAAPSSRCGRAFAAIAKTGCVAASASGVPRRPPAR